MTVRAKFKVDSIERSTTTAKTGEDAAGKPIYGPVETQTIKLFPVYGNDDPTHENTKFWHYTPAGEIRLSTINKAAGDYFELGKEYYIDFIKAE